MATVTTRSRRIVDEVTLTLTREEAKLLEKYLDLGSDPLGFRLANEDLYQIQDLLIEALGD